MRWLYADGVEAITDRLVEDELRRRFPAGFRVSPREDQINYEGCLDLCLYDCDTEFC